jgi:Zn-dependent M28 family amino/carboxypeptidase
MKLASLRDLLQSRAHFHTWGRWVACLAVISLPLALISCGGGGSSDGSASSTLSSSTDPSLTSDEAQAKNEAEAEAQQKLGNYKLACLLRRNNTPEKLTECVTLEGVRFHQRVFQFIADNNKGTRVSGTKGYDDSVRYAEAVFKAFGYIVTKQDFEFQAFIKLTPAVLEQVTTSGNQPIDFDLLSYSGSGDVTAPTSSPSVLTGCNTADFAGFTTGNVALISRGGCTFATKANNAAAAGAKAVVIFNNREGDMAGTTLGNDFTQTFPVAGITQVKGSELLTISGLQLRVKADTFRDTATTSNLIAESREGDPDNVVMVGAHLDSVDEGPGINDNGSGSAAVLETAIQMARVKPKNKVRFALWGAEEAGLVGSTRYISLLSDADRAKIALYLNFDMIGSPNPVYFIYDGDDSDKEGAGSGPNGSAAIEKLFEKFYTDRQLPFKGTDFSGRSDYGPFIAIGIPSGGLFTGAEGKKTAEEAQIFGGTAGEDYDKCYHKACDTFDNVNLTALDVNADSVAYNTLVWAMDLTPLGTRTPTANKLQQDRQKYQSTVPAWTPYPKLVFE